MMVKYPGYFNKNLRYNGINKRFKSFKITQSEKIIEMARSNKYWIRRFFGDVEKFKLWLDTQNFALNRV